MIEIGEYNQLRWSSGQQILLLSMSTVLADIEEESILLIDEPEIHLHPNAIANFMRMLNRLLNKYNSYAIVATHSPIVLQEIPKENISVMERMDDITVIRLPGVETFGENISRIIDDVFEVMSTESSFKTILRQASLNLDKESIMQMFNGKLSINAMLYLNTLYGE